MGVGEEETYRLPSANVRVKPSFCHGPICSRQMKGMGVMMRKKSVMTLGMELPRKVARRSRQSPSVGYPEMS